MEPVARAAAGAVELGWLLGIMTTLGLAYAVMAAVRRLPWLRGSWSPGGSEPLVVDPLVATGTSADGRRVRVLAAATLELTGTVAGQTTERIRPIVTALEAELADGLAGVSSEELAVRLPALCREARVACAPVGRRHGVTIHGFDAYAAEIVLPVDPHPPR